MANRAQDNDYLKIGDLVSFKSIQYAAYMFAEGILVEDITVTDDIKLFDNCIFCVHLQRKYSASKEFQNFLKTNQNANLEDRHTQKYLQALQRGMDNENKLNDTYMKNKLGDLVNFGDFIQLYHVKSRKYLRVSPNKLAKGERENLHVSLDAQGDSYSWLQVSPRYKIDKDGDKIATNSELYLRVVEKPGEFLHCADRDPGKHDREVNCSLESCSWRLSIFQSSLDAMDSKLVMAAQLVYINDPEKNANLTIGKRGNVALEDQSIYTGTPDTHVHNYGDIVLQPIQNKKSSSTALWVIESKKLIQGGPIHWKTHQVRVKNLSTGLYLFLTTQGSMNELGHSIDRSILTTTDDASLPGTLFDIQELNGTNNLLGFGKPVQISQNGAYLESLPDLLEDLSFMVKLTRDTSAAINFKIYRYNESGEIEEGTEEDEEAKATTESKEPLDVFVSVAARNYLRNYLHMIYLPPKGKNATTIWPSADDGELEFFHSILERAVLFCQGHSISQQEGEQSIEIGDYGLRARRQDLLREQGVLEALLRIINKLIPISIRSEKKAAQDAALIESGNDVLSVCFSLLLASVKDKPLNQMYVADHMPVLLSHLGNQPLAGTCVTEMLATNLELQETKIGTREIAIFVEKLRSSRLNAMYLQLLQSCCSCQGNGVDGNQCKVTNMLFEGDTDDIVIKLITDYSFATKIMWESSIFIPSSSESSAPIFGGKVLTDGLPTLVLTIKGEFNGGLLSISRKSQSLSSKVANVSSFDFLKMFGTNITKFGTDESGLNTIRRKRGGGLPVGSPSPGAVTFSPAKAANGNIELSVTVASYFVAQMFLGAEMCLDRNYVAINTLERMYPYEVLVSILKMDVNDKIKAAAARMLLCLHVDRDPQSEARIPCLTRSWAQMQEHITSPPMLPHVETYRRNNFCLIQDIISYQVKDIQGRKWSELPKQMLLLQKKLISFSFYETIDKMDDVIRPTIRLLDRRLTEKQYVDYSRNKSSMSLLRRASTRNIGVDHSVLDVKEESLSPEMSPEMVERWQGKLLTFLESMTMMLAMLVLVLIAVAMAVVETTMSSIPSDTGSPMYIAGIIITAIFIVEVSLRAYCHVVVRGRFLNFLKNFFNQIDIGVILIDIVFLSLPDGLMKESKYAKVLRLVRLIRLARVLRAARVVTRLRDLAKDKVVKWVPPNRHSRCPLIEIQTMAEAVDILGLAQRVIEDRNLTLLLRYFCMWESGAEKRSPSVLFEQVMEESSNLTLNVEDFNNVFVDILMFNNNSLVQRALEVMMGAHSTRQTLVENAKEIQLMVSHKHEKQFKHVDQILQELERNAETHELWGELKSDEDCQTNVRTKEILNDLITMCRARRKVLEFNSDFMPDTEVQNLYRNLGCFDISLKVLGLLDSVEEDDNGEVDEVGANTRELCLLCNTLLYWFMYDNPTNQELGFSNLDFFLDTLDAKISSHRVLEAIFHDNERLIKLVPLKQLMLLAEKIVKSDPEERSYHDLFLFLSVTNVGDKNIKENQLEIMRQLTSPVRLSKISSFFVPIAHPDYETKRELMAPFLDVKDVSVDDLPPMLSYHLTLMDVLSRCTVGRYNVTTIEAKVQSIFKSNDLIDSILDDGTCLIAKIYQCQLLFNSTIEVEMIIPGFEYSASIWRLIESATTLLAFAKDEVRKVEKLGWDHKSISRQSMEYLVVTIMIIGGFFSKYYKKDSFRIHEGAQGSNRVQLTPIQINEIVHVLFKKIKDVYDLDSPKFSQLHKSYFYKALVALNNAAISVIVTDLPATHLAPPKQDLELNKDQAFELKVVHAYNEFVKAIEENDSTQEKNLHDNMMFSNILNTMAKIEDEQGGDIRQESLFKRLVGLIKDNIKLQNNEKYIDPAATKTAIWVIKSWRSCIETRMGMSIAERDDDGGEEQDEAAAPIIAVMNECGVVPLCVDLIAVGIDANLQIEAVSLCVAMLFKEGGALAVQTIINNYLRTTDSYLFFKQLRNVIQKLTAWHTWRGAAVLEDGTEPELPEDIIFLRFMQLLSEGHYLPNQDVMREQSNSEPFNLLDDLVNFLNVLSKLHCRTSTAAGSRLCSVILEIIQGPCRGNQTYFAMETELLEIFNRLLRSKDELDCDHDEEIELKKAIIDILQGLLEGQNSKSVVYERILSVIHFDIILLLTESERSEGEENEEGGEGKKEAKEEISEEEEVFRAECTVLINMMCDFKPALRKSLGLNKEDSDSNTRTVSVEIMWDGELQRRFFYVPTLCDLVAKSSMDRLVEEVDRSNLDTKLIDFMKRVNGIYREVKHQQFLTEIRVNRVFSQQNHERATWFSFFICCLINALFLAFYENTEDGPTYSNSVRNAINALNGIQIAVASFTLLQSIVVRTPLTYQAVCDSESNIFNRLFYTATEPMTLYYCGYLSFCILGMILDDFFLTILLLDIIVKNSTTKNVLMAAYIPRESLGMTLVLGVFIMYIYAFFTFVFVRGTTLNEGVCDTLWGCFKLYMDYGLLAGGGIQDVMEQTLDWHILLGFTFFVIVTIILLNVIFGIIIDTFSALRFEKDDRIANTVGVCFMCGIEKLVFDRAGDGLNGFKDHIKNDHLMWNYLRFVFHLWEQDKDDDDGLELFVRRCITTGDITWMPMNKALRLTQKESVSELLKQELLHDIAETEARLSENLKNLQSEANIFLSQLKTALKADHGGHGAKKGIALALLSISNQSLAQSSTVREDEMEEAEEMEVTSLGSDLDLGVNIFIEILEIEGINLPNEELSGITCRIVCDLSVFSVQCESVRDSVVVFKNSPFLICTNAHPGDDRKCLLQVLDLQGIFGEKTPGAFRTVGTSYGNVELDMDELMNGCDTVLTRTLLNEQVTDGQSNYVIRIRPSCVSASENEFEI